MTDDLIPSTDIINALLAGTHSDPFAVLGLHELLAQAPAQLAQGDSVTTTAQVAAHDQIPNEPAKTPIAAKTATKTVGKTATSKTATSKKASTTNAVASKTVAIEAASKPANKPASKPANKSAANKSVTTKSTSKKTTVSKTAVGKIGASKTKASKAFAVKRAPSKSAEQPGCGKRFAVRVLLPGAAHIQLVDCQGEWLADFQTVHAGGFFVAEVIANDRFDYRLRVQFDHGEPVILADAYALPSQISDADLYALTHGDPRPYLILGAHAKTVTTSQTNQVNGVQFAVWAPNAKRVSVVGDFNNWDGRRHVMRLRHQAGVWEIFVPHVQIGDLYKFEVQNSSGHLLPAKADPYARATELRPGTASRVAGAPTARKLPAERAPANQREAAISIYEVHLGSWRQQADGSFLTWSELAQSLPAYAQELGFTHIELMPISEFPFDGSWGYQTLALFAPTARFGDAAGFAEFVQACHAHGLGLIIDWVPAHFPSDGHGLVHFDGTALYEYADTREGFHKDWNTLIYNFARNEVRQFLIASALYWCENFGVDGLRVDAVASMLYRDYSRNHGEWVPNQFGGRENLEAISLFKAMNECLGNLVPGSITVAEESTAFPAVSKPTYHGGLGFHYKWNMGWMNDTLRYIAEDPVHRRWHHDKLTFGLVYAFSENYVLPISHDEVVHGKGSLWQKMPGDDWQKFANVRAYLGFMWGHPGKKLLFMGQEFAQRDEWNHQHALPWHLLDHEPHRGVQQWVKDLNKLYRAEPALHRLDCEGAGFQWLIIDDRENSVLAFARFADPRNCVVVLCNFTPVPRQGYRVPLPEGVVALEEVLNSDSQFYGGSNVGNGPHWLVAEAPAHNVHGDNAAPMGAGRHSVALTLPPLASIFLKAHFA